MIYFRPIGLFGAGLFGANVGGLIFAAAAIEPAGIVIHLACALAGLVLMRAGATRRAA